MDGPARLLYCVFSSVFAYVCVRVGRGVRLFSSLCIFPHFPFHNGHENWKEIYRRLSVSDRGEKDGHFSPDTYINKYTYTHTFLLRIDTLIHTCWRTEFLAGLYVSVHHSTIDDRERAKKKGKKRTEKIYHGLCIRMEKGANNKQTFRITMPLVPFDFLYIYIYI